MAIWTLLLALLMQVPAAQRAQSLVALYTMSPQQRADLAVLVQRTPPQDRDQIIEATGRRSQRLVEQLER